MSDKEMYEGYATQDFEREEWWLAAPEHLLVWARLRVLDSGVAHVFDSQGDTLTYESDDIAKAALMDADFRSLDGMDEDDAEAIGMMLDEWLQVRAANLLFALDSELHPRGIAAGDGPHRAHGGDT